ncbi:hypothetical protein AXF42_Ash021023 [Apostasia shenzhenica]|uniref:Uncharacterized protein n=1 Tax=Apostasia shenzhenica TaxID=1088818 RepID=A0A2I0ADV4_9ASPA|nr:hypothetical protein AXF42_Ash021023 [Apostasia shenzhenica]
MSSLFFAGLLPKFAAHHIRRRSPLWTEMASELSTSPFSERVSSRVSAVPSPSDLLAGSCQRRQRKLVKPNFLPCRICRDRRGGAAIVWWRRSRMN